MSLALAFLPTSLLIKSETRRRKGRPKNSDDPAKRERQIRYAGLVLAGVVKIQEAADALQVSASTIYRWISDLLDDGQPDTEGIRRLMTR